MTNPAITHERTRTPDSFISHSEPPFVPFDAIPDPSAYLGESTPSDEERRGVLRVMFAERALSRSNPGISAAPGRELWPATKAGLSVLVLASGWAETDEGNAFVSRDSWEPEFAAWMANNYPDPVQVAVAMRDWREFGRGDDRGARLLAEDLAASGSGGLNSAFSLIWGERWNRAQEVAGIDFNYSPVSEAGLAGRITERAQADRKIRVHRLAPGEQILVGNRQESPPVMTAKESKEKYEVDAEMRGVAFLGNPLDSGSAFGVFDVSDGEFLRNHPELQEAASDSKLMLLPAVLGGRAKEQDETGSRYDGPLLIEQFDKGNVVFLHERDGEVELGRPTNETDENILAQLFPQKDTPRYHNRLSSVSQTVSEHHAWLVWRGTSWGIINQNPHNDTLLQCADVGTERQRQIAVLQRRAGALVAAAQGRHTTRQ